MPLSKGQFSYLARSRICRNCNLPCFLDRMKADRERQLLLARERMANRRRRKADGKEENLDYDELPLPSDGKTLICVSI